MANRQSQETILRCTELTAQGLHPEEIAAELGLHEHSVYRALGIADVDPVRKPISQEYVTPRLDPIWAAEFRGYFCGDGCVGIYRRKNSRAKHLYLYSPSLSVSARVDNEPLLKEIQKNLGGKLSYLKGSTRSGYKTHPNIRWYLYGWANCRGVIEALNFVDARISAKKIEEIWLTYECILKRFEMPFRLRKSDVAILESYYVQCKALKNF